MKNIAMATLAFLLLNAAYAQSSNKDKIVGSWVRTDQNGKEVKLQISPDEITTIDYTNQSGTATPNWQQVTTTGQYTFKKDDVIHINYGDKEWGLLKIISVDGRQLVLSPSKGKKIKWTYTREN